MVASKHRKSKKSDESSDSTVLDIEKKKPFKPKRSIIDKCCGCLCKPCIKFFRSEPHTYSSWKMLFGFPFGALLGYGLYRLVVLPMELGEDTRNVLGALVVFGISAGYSLSVSFRCVCLLLIPTFMGKAGRSYIGTFAIAYLIAGPIENIVDNTQDITRSLTCAAQLSANHTASKWKFRIQPVGNIFEDIAGEGYMLNRLSKKVNTAFAPIRSEIRGEDEVAEMEARTVQEDDYEGGNIDRAAKIEAETEDKPNDDEADKVENKYRKKIKFECEDVYNKAVQQCKVVFGKIVHNCRRKLPKVIRWLCKLADFSFVCKLVEPLGKALGGECKTDNVIKPSFGKMYQKSEESLDNMDEGFEVKLQYSVVKGSDDIDYTSVEEMRSNTMHSFKQGRDVVEFVFVVIKRLLGFTFVLVIISAYKYYKKFVTDVRFDNIYITSYFKKIDARRKYQEKKVLLPLKKLEKGQYIFPTSLKLMKSERAKLGKGTFLIIARAVLAWIVFLVADIMYTVLKIIRTHSRVDYKQTGINNIDVTVGGTGFMSNIVRLFLNGLNTKAQMNETSSNVECLPRPVPVDNIYYYYVFGIFLLVWVLVLLDAYGLRLRTLIAGFFFRKREKQRILFLYNSMMRRRKCFLKDMRRKVKRRAKEMKLNKRSGLLYALNRQCPILCACLAITNAGKERCLVCEEFLGKKNLKRCDNEDCSFGYCTECWRDLKKTCYACLPLDEFFSTDSDSLNEDGDDDDM